MLKKIIVTYFMKNGEKIEDKLEILKEATEEERAKIFEKCKELSKLAAEGKLNYVVMGNIYVNGKDISAIKLESKDE